MGMWRQIAEDIAAAHFNRRFTSLRALHGARRAWAVADVLLNSRVLAVALFRAKRGLQRRRVPVLPALLDRL